MGKGGCHGWVLTMGQGGCKDMGKYIGHGWV